MTESKRPPASSRIRRRRRGRLLTAAALGTAAALTVASDSWAQVSIGYTWYDDGTFSKSGSSPATFAFFATGANPNKSFALVSSNNLDPNHDPTHVCLDTPQQMNPSTRFSNARGFIATTRGTVNRPQGEWQICFRELNGASATNPVFFTVL